MWAEQIAPIRETANILRWLNVPSRHGRYKISLGTPFRGATWVSLHNGGGVGWGEAVNGGFGMNIDGSRQSAQIAISIQ